MTARAIDYLAVGALLLIGLAPGAVGQALGHTLGAFAHAFMSAARIAF